MGKGTIKSNLGDGRYSVQLRLKRDHIEKEIDRLQKQIAAMDIKIADMEPGPEKSIAELQRTAFQKRLDYLQEPGNVPIDPIISAWCADRTEDLEDDVGTIEIPGERGAINIQSGYDENAIYDQTRDGQLEPSIAGTPEGTFYNMAMLPGWQKFKPTYRYGIISNLNGDICDIALDSVQSSQQDLDINQTTELHSVPIEYMDCNGAAFENGDEVIIKFEGQDWSNPKVIGFKDHPEYCGFFFRLTCSGDLVDDDPVWSLQFKCYDYNQQIMTITTPVYDGETGYWYFTIVEPEDVMNGFWVLYTCSGGRWTQYDAIWRLSQRYDENDLIPFGKYESEIEEEGIYITINSLNMITVWDAKAGAAAADVENNDGDFAAFPCERNKISDWLGQVVSTFSATDVTFDDSPFAYEDPPEPSFPDNCDPVEYPGDSKPTSGLPGYTDSWYQELYQCEQYFNPGCGGSLVKFWEKQIINHETFEHFATLRYFSSWRAVHGGFEGIVRTEHRYENNGSYDNEYYYICEPDPPPDHIVHRHFDYEYNDNEINDVAIETYMGELVSFTHGQYHAGTISWEQSAPGWDYIVTDRNMNVQYFAYNNRNAVKKCMVNERLIFNVLFMDYRLDRTDYDGFVFYYGYLDGPYYGWNSVVTTPQQRIDAVLASANVYESTEAVNPFAEGNNPIFAQAIKDLIEAEYASRGLGNTDIEGLNLAVIPKITK